MSCYSIQEVIQKLLKDPIVQSCRLRREEEDPLPEKNSKSVNSLTDRFGASGSTSKEGEDESMEIDGDSKKDVPEDIYSYLEKIENDDEDADDSKTVSFEVNLKEIETLQKRCIELDHPLLAEYDFKNDTQNRDIK